MNFLKKQEYDIFIYYPREKLPKEGWIQPCFNCDMITSSYIFHKKYNKIFDVYNAYVYTCPKCIKKFKAYPKKAKMYIKRCNDFIAKNHNKLL